MNKKLSMAVAGAVMAFGASAANAGIVIPAGDWTLDIGGIVNTYYTSTRATGTAVAGGLAFGNATGDKTESNITTGLLPNYLSVSGKTRQNDLDVGFTISIQPGVSRTQAGNQGAQQENRQAFLTFGDKSWGTVKLGKDIGIFASDAILNDMTLLGVGSGAGVLAGNTTTLGRIGTGFIYADWKSQISYWSPNWNGFSFGVGVTQAWNAINFSGLSAGSTGRAGSAPALEGKAQYEWAGDFAGKVWTSFISQKVEGLAAGGDERATAWDIGANVNVAGFGLTGYYYDGRGIGSTLQLADGFDVTGKRRDSDGGYVQATYVIPTGTKIGASWGISNLDGNAVDRGSRLLDKNEMWVVGAYHPLTKHLNLVAEYSDVQSEAQAGPDAKARTVSLGAIMFF